MARRKSAGSKGKPEPGAPRIKNRRAYHDYEVMERIEAGIILQGSEVKSVRAGRVSLKESFARIQDDELWLLHMDISPYAHAPGAHLPKRKRKLLVHRRELKRLVGKLQLRGLTMVPLAMFFNERGIAKVQLGLCRGKAKYDKRQDHKKRDHQRDMDRALSARNS